MPSESHNTTEDPTPWLWKRGQSGNPGGKKKLPEWLTGKSDELLLIQHRAAMTGRLPIADEDGTMGTATQVVPPGERLLAACRLLDRIHGTAPRSPEEIEASGEIINGLVARIAAGMLPDDIG